MSWADTLTPDEEAAFRQMKAADKATESPPSSAELVDHREFEQERQLRQQTEARLREVETQSAANLARTQERLDLLAQAAHEHVARPQPAPAASETPPPEFLTDPAGYIQHGFRTALTQNRQLQERLQHLETGVAQRIEAQRAQQALGELTSWGVGQEQEFAQATPDYREAVTHLANARERAIRAAGVTDATQIRNAVAGDVVATAAMARQSGQQFGRVLYDLAQAHGYRPSTNAGDPVERLLRGTTPNATVTRIADMSDAAFEKAYGELQKHGARGLRALFGE